MKKVQLRDMILWAKDRCFDDLYAFMEDEGDRLAEYNQSQLAQLEKMCHLLSLPDDEKSTLVALSESYWNGPKDTFWEYNPMPEGFIG